MSGPARSPRAVQVGGSLALAALLAACDPSPAAEPPCEVERVATWNGEELRRSCTPFELHVTFAGDAVRGSLGVAGAMDEQAPNLELSFGGEVLPTSWELSSTGRDTAPEPPWSAVLVYWYEPEADGLQTLPALVDGTATVQLASGRLHVAATGRFPSTSAATAAAAATFDGPIRLTCVECPTEAACAPAAEGARCSALRSDLGL